VCKPKELAAMIMKNDKKWNPKDRNRDEQRRRLFYAQNKIPVYIGYFTAWVDADGVVHFYEDVYKETKH
jgi:murein L,D-transpeptidase YcbB/YkuD